MEDRKGKSIITKEYQGKKSGVRLESYNDQVSLCEIREYNGKYYNNWGYTRLGGKENQYPADKARPWSMPLGTNKDEVREALFALLDDLDNTFPDGTEWTDHIDSREPGSDDDAPGDDIPF